MCILPQSLSVSGGSPLLNIHSRVCRQGVFPGLLGVARSALLASARADSEERMRLQRRMIRGIGGAIAKRNRRRGTCRASDGVVALSCSFGRCHRFGAPAVVTGYDDGVHRVCVAAVSSKSTFRPGAEAARP